MASTRLLKAKDGRRYYEIRCHKRGRGEKTTRWYIPDGWSDRAIKQELPRQVAAFEQSFLQGDVLTRTEEAKKRAEEEAERAAAEAERAKLKTFRQYAEGVYLPAKALETSENTQASYKSNLENHVFPVLGETLLVDITSAMITKLLLDFAQNHSHASMVKVYNIINGVLDMAFLDDSILVNPMLKVKKLRMKKEEKGTDKAKKALDSDTEIKLRSCLAREPLKWQVFVELALDTACRRGELCALEWNDIDLDNCLVYVKNNLQYTPGKGVYFTSPKNGEADQVDIGEETAALLRRWKKEQKKICICKYVFNPEKSNQYKHVEVAHKQSKKKKPIPIESMPMNPQTPTRYFKKFGEKYGIEDFHPHILRHTAATDMMMNGANPAAVSARLRHKDKSLAMKWYTHPDTEDVRRAGQAARDARKAAAGEK